MANNSTGTSAKKPLTKKMKILLACGLGAIVLIVIILIACAGPKYQWPTSGLATLLPEPDGKIVELADDSDSFEAYIKVKEEEQYKDYKELCTNKGFTITDDLAEVAYNDIDTNYSAFNKDGNLLCLAYDDSDGKLLKVFIRTNFENKTFEWPTTGIGATLPKPNTCQGEVKYQYDDSFSVYLTNMPRTEYNDYVSKCKEIGYTKNEMAEDFSYEAYKNDENVSINLKLEYIGNKTMYLYINDSTPEPEVKEEEKENQPTSAPSQESTTVSTEIKTLMDNYEAFVDEYCAFMKRYKASGMPADMASQLMDMTSKQADWVSKIDALDTDSMSTADAAYVAEVSARCSQKTLEVA